MRDSSGPLQRGVHFWIHHQMQQRLCSKCIVLSRITPRRQYRKRSNRMCVKAKSVSRPVSVVALLRLPRSCARGILGCSCSYCRHHFGRKTISPSRNQCDPDLFFFNRIGPILRTVSTNEYRPPRGYREAQFDPTFFLRIRGNLFDAAIIFGFDPGWMCT